MKKDKLFKKALKTAATRFILSALLFSRHTNGFIPLGSPQKKKLISMAYTLTRQIKGSTRVFLQVSTTIDV